MEIKLHFEQVDPDLQRCMCEPKMMEENCQKEWEKQENF